MLPSDADDREATLLLAKLQPRTGLLARLLRPIKESADRWLQGPEAYRRTVETQSLKLPDDTVPTMMTLLPGK